MEKKAKLKGIRKEFFKYLQKSRDRAKREHADCTKDARLYLVDLWTWENFFGPEAFPGIKPFGAHSHLCIKKDLLAAKRSTPLDTENESAAHQSPGLPSVVKKDTLARDASRLKASAHQGGQTPLLSTHVAITASALPQQSQQLFVLIKVVYESGIASFITGKTAKIEVTTKAAKSVASQLYQKFKRDDGRKIQSLKTSLKCGLEAVQSPDGSLVFSIKPFRSGGDDACQIALRFVVGWIKTCVGGNMENLSSFADTFTPSTSGVKDPSLLTAHTLFAPICFLVNGKYVALDPTEFKMIRNAFLKDVRRREALEIEMGCRFLLVEYEEAISPKHLIASTRGPDGGLPPAARFLPYTVLWHPEEGSLLNNFLEKWVLKVGGCVSDQQAPSIPVFWEEYTKAIRDAAISRSNGSAGDVEPSLIPDQGPAMDLDGMVQEEAARAAFLPIIAADSGESRIHPDRTEGLDSQDVKGEESSRVGESGQSDLPLGEGVSNISNESGGGDTGAAVGGQKRKLGEEEEEEGEIVEKRARVQ